MATLSTSSNPHFFKIILPHTLAQRKLDLPKKFVKNHGDSLLYNKATLRLPDGAKWEVHLLKSDGNVSFLRGWSEFLDFYSIQAGYFLVFQCHGICCFHVLIFDLTTTGIDYPTKKPPPQVFHRLRKDRQSRRSPVLVPKSESEEDSDSDSDSDSVHILTDAVLRKRRNKDKQPAACSSLREMKKMMGKKNVTMTLQRFDEEEEEEEDPETNYRGGSAHNYGDDGESMRPRHPPKAPQPLTENEERVLRRASSYKLRRKNPSFMVTMRPSYIQTGNNLSLPRTFSERHLKESVDVKLEVADGRSWSVWCGVRWAFTRRRTEFKGGWKSFALDNQLQEGDICVFELINKIPIVYFKVTIFRALN